MKTRHLKILAGTLLLVGITSLKAQATPTVSLNLLDSEIYVGDNFDVQVWVDGDDIGLELLSFGFDIDIFDSAFFYDGYTVETGFDDDSDWVDPQIAGSAFPGIADDEWLLATLSFTAIETGTGSLQISGITDQLFYGLAYEIDPITLGWYDINASLDITINSSTPSPVPEPTTMLLFGIGISGFIGSNIRRMKNHNDS